jgi:TonB family protein
MFAPAFGVHFQSDSLNVDWILSLEPLSAMIRVDGVLSSSATVPDEDHLQLFELMRRPFPKDHELVARHIIEEERHLSQSEPEEEVVPITGAAEAISYGGCDCRVSIVSEVPCYDEPPWAITAPPPIYPKFAAEARIQGTVVLLVLVEADGHISNIKVFRGVTGLNDATVDAVRKWVFKPALKDGRPVCVWTEVPVDFHF